MKDNYIVHVFKLAGESVVHVKANSVEDAQHEALAQAPELTFSQGQAKYVAMGYEALDLGLPQEDSKNEV